MKKLLAILLAAMMTLGMFAIAVSADYAADYAAEYAEEINLSASAAVLAELFPEDNVRIHMGFAKHNADYFSSRATEGMRFSLVTPTFYETDRLFSINRATGAIRFNVGPSSLLRGAQTVRVSLDGAIRDVTVRAYYQWYEYFVIIFAAGWFWMAAINNG